MVPQIFNDSQAADGVIAILAAGSATRMLGGDKCLEPVHGVPLLRVLAERAIATGWAVIVTIAPGAKLRRDAVEDLPLDVIEVPDAAEGMSASFRALSHLQVPVMITLADMPEIQTSDFDTLIAAYDGSCPVRATTEDGTPGQPVLFPPDDVTRMRDLSGDTGGKFLLRDRRVQSVRLPGRRAITDLDTPEEWALWRARTGISR